MSREELAQIADVARQHNLLVVSDEIYSRLVYETSHTCFASLPGMKEGTILLGGFSKAYAMSHDKDPPIYRPLLSYNGADGSYRSPEFGRRRGRADGKGI